MSGGNALPDPWIGAILAEPSVSGRFVSLRQLRDASRGNFGYVFEADDLVTGRTAVLKFLKPDHLANDPSADARFKREGEISTALQGHPNILQLVAPPGVHNVHLKLADNNTLTIPLRYIATERATKDFDAFLFGPRRRPSVLWRKLQVVRDVVKGVARLHSLGYCHRDLKPDNIFLFPGGTSKLADLGLCRRIDDPTLIQSYYDQPVGHKLYAAPETFCGSGNDPRLHKRADWFSVGAILFEAVAMVRLYPAIGLQSPLQVIVFFIKHGPLEEFERVVGDIAGAHPIPSIHDITPRESIERMSPRTIEAVDALIRRLCHFDHRRRLCDVRRVLSHLDVAIEYARLDEQRRDKLLARRPLLIEAGKQ